MYFLSILNEILHLPVLPLVLIIMECLISWHFGFTFTKLELTWSWMVVPTVINGLLERGWILRSFELDVTFWSANFFLYLRKLNFPHGRYINQRSDLTIRYVCCLSYVPFILTLMLSWRQTLEWRNILVLIWCCVYLWEIKVHPQWSKLGYGWRLVEERLFCSFTSPHWIHGWIHQGLWLLVIKMGSLLIFELRSGSKIILMGSSVDVIWELFFARGLHNIVLTFLALPDALVNLAGVDR